MAEEEIGWFDTSPYQAVMPYVEIANISGAGAALTIVTGPSVDVSGGGATLFQKMLDAAANASTYTVTGVQTLRAFRFSDAQTPPGLLLRWSATGSAAWSVTFRIALGLLERPLSARLLRGAPRSPQRATAASLPTVLPRSRGE